MSVYIEWQNHYNTGVVPLDREHREIVRLINALYDAAAPGVFDSKKKSILDALVRYTATHFEHEEQWMRECNFPPYAAHKALHDRMRERTLELRKNLNVLERHDLLGFLKSWWIDHIQKEDQQYAPYANAILR